MVRSIIYKRIERAITPIKRSGVSQRGVAEATTYKPVKYLIKKPKHIGVKPIGTETLYCDYSAYFLILQKIKFFFFYSQIRINTIVR